jgi:hypothetical protein
MIGGGRMVKNNSRSRALSTSFMCNGEVIMFDCWCPISCVVRQYSEKPRKTFLRMPFSKGLLKNGYVWFNVMHFCS